jgi:beta-aspartyl-peptidase (threonine type)
MTMIPTLSNINMENFAIVIHGGAEGKKPDEVSPEEQEAYKQGLEEAILAGWNILNDGGSAVDAVEAAVRKLEDNPMFNAGRGSALTQSGKIEMNASIMCGKTLQAGAVGAVKSVKNPISLARTIMDKTKHVFLVAEGAEKFAKEYNIETRPTDYFLTEKQQKQLEEAQQEESITGHDTVGAVALDKHGNLAAAASTGGLVNQYDGRIGDSAMIGVGVYANNDVCAISCTGDGEALIKGVVGHEIYAMLKYKSAPLQDACKKARELYKERIKGDRNLIALNTKGEIVMEFETELMFRAYKRGNEPHKILIWENTEC